MSTHTWIAAEAYSLTDDQATRVASGLDPRAVGGVLTSRRQLFCASCNREWPAADTAGVCSVQTHTGAPGGRGKRRGKGPAR
jgi:hypothetical protein